MKKCFTNDHIASITGALYFALAIINQGEQGFWNMLNKDDLKDIFQQNQNEIIKQAFLIQILKISNRKKDGVSKIFNFISKRNMKVIFEFTLNIAFNFKLFEKS